MIAKRYIYAIGIISILISALAWCVDFMGLVDICRYCRSERTVIGILGLIMLFPVIPHITRLLALIVGFFGASVACQHLMLIILKFSNMQELTLVICALVTIIAQVYFINYYCSRNRSTY